MILKSLSCMVIMSVMELNVFSQSCLASRRLSSIFRRSDRCSLMFDSMKSKDATRLFISSPLMFPVSLPAMSRTAFSTLIRRVTRGAKSLMARAALRRSATTMKVLKTLKWFRICSWLSCTISVVSNSVIKAKPLSRTSAVP